MVVVADSTPPIDSRSRVQLGFVLRGPHSLVQSNGDVHLGSGSIPDFFFNQVNWVVNLPISPYSSFKRSSYSARMVTIESFSSKRLGRPSTTIAFHRLSCVGWTSYSAAI